MVKTFKDTIEIKITLDTNKLKSICDKTAADFPNRGEGTFFNIAMENIIHEYFSCYIWYCDEGMPICEVEEMCPTIIHKIGEYIDWYIIHYYLTKQEDFQWSD